MLTVLMKVNMENHESIRTALVSDSKYICMSLDEFRSQFMESHIPNEANNFILQHYTLIFEGVMHLTCLRFDGHEFIRNAF